MRATRTRTARTTLGLAGLALVTALAAAVPLLSAPSARAAEPVVEVVSDFEDGTTQGWRPRADEVVASSTAAAHGGQRSLLVEGRTRSWEGPVLDLLGTVDPGIRYTLSVWVRLAAGEAPAQARLSVERRTGDDTSYDQVVGNTAVSAGGWVHLSGQYTLATEVDFLTTYVETADGTAALHIDDFTLSYVPALPIQTDIPAVKDVITEFPVGAAIGLPQIVGAHAQLLTRHFDSVTPGNALKWDATEPVEGQFRFGDADAMVNFARANGLAVRGHTLVWHQQTPAWVFRDAAGNEMTPTAANKALLLDRLENHIRGVVGRYGTDIGVWDVVNEVIDEGQADGMRRSRWYELTGLDYIRTAFRVAREVAPTAKLFINDYNTNVPAKRDRLYDLVAQLRAEGVPVDGVGHQMHVNVEWPSVAETEAMLTRFIPLGVDQQVTEMDVSIYINNSESFPTPPRDRLLRQAYKYRDLFALYRRYADHISSVTIWGLADDDTWLDTFPVTRNDAPLLFDEQLQAKPAYWGVVDPSRIESTPSAPPSVSPSPSLSGTASPTPSESWSPPTSASPSASASITPTDSPLPRPCRAAYRVLGQWTGGFQGEVTITCPHGSDGWTLGWVFPDGQRITQAWNGTATQNGAEVTVAPVSYNRSIPVGGSVTVGFIGTWTGGNTAPAQLYVNGLPALP